MPVFVPCFLSEFSQERELPTMLEMHVGPGFPEG